MLHTYPDYYKEFKCIADKCRHNCCIGWEIDIDEDAAALYKIFEGNFGQKIKENIDFDEENPHFILAQDERCPFLNKDNLCDIIIHAGKESLCTICREHPRFHNELPDRVESGLGLCCEEAARIILTNKDKVQLISNSDSDDEIIILRDKVFTTLQDRSLTIDERCEEILSLCNTTLPCLGISDWADMFLELERLDENWTDILTLLRIKGDSADTTAFNEYMKDRQTEYEQFLHYLIYRHFANAPNLYEAGIRAAFAVLCYKLIYFIGVSTWDKDGSFTVEDQIELCRMFSGEIEYSDENLYAVFDELEQNLQFSENSIIKS